MESNEESNENHFPLVDITNDAEVLMQDCHENTTQVPVKTIGLKRDNVWLFFKEHKGNSICQVSGCKKMLAGRYTTNLKLHLKRCHPAEFHTIDKKSKRDEGQFQIPKYGLQSKEQLRCNRALALWVGSTSTIPVNIVQQEGFKDFINVVDPKINIPCRLTLQQNIHEIFLEMRSTIQVKLQSARCISISADIWSKRGLSSSYLGVLATFYDPIQQEKQVILLDVKKLETVSHKADDIIREMAAVVEKYEIPTEKIWFTTTDSASNMVCAFRDSTAFEYEQIPNGIVDDAEQLPNEIHEPRKYARYSCFIHSLLLCLKPFDTDTMFTNVIDKVKAVVAKITNSTILTGILQKKTGVTLLRFSDARWNIKYLVLHRVIRVREHLGRILEDFGDSNLLISVLEWEEIHKIHDFLEPFNTYTDMTSTDTTTYFSEATPIMRVLEDHLKRYIADSSSNLSSIAEEVLLQLRQRFMSYSVARRAAEDTTLTISLKPLELYLSATLLDPRNCQYLDSVEESIAKKCILDILGADVNTPTTVSQTNIEGNSSSRKYNIAPKTSRIVRNKVQSENAIESEIEMYLEAKYGQEFTISSQCDPIEFWVNHSTAYRNLAPLALDLLCLPLNTAPLERSFSIGSVAAQKILLSRNKKIL